MFFIRMDINLQNTRMWWRRSDGAFIINSNVVKWLNDRDIFDNTSRIGMYRQDVQGYTGYRYGSKEALQVIKGVYVIVYQYGDIRLGPDAHLYQDPHMVNGPIAGGLVFNGEQRDLAMLFKLTWG
jgi:hypothetical protein